MSAYAYVTTRDGQDHTFVFDSRPYTVSGTRKTLLPMEVARHGEERLTPHSDGDPLPSYLVVEPFSGDVSLQPEAPRMTCSLCGREGLETSEFAAHVTECAVRSATGPNRKAAH